MPTKKHGFPDLCEVKPNSVPIQTLLYIRPHAQRRLSPTQRPHKHLNLQMRREEKCRGRHVLESLRIGEDVVAQGFEKYFVQVIEDGILDVDFEGFTRWFLPLVRWC